MYLLASLIMQNFYKKVLQLIQSYKDVRYFLGPKQPIYPEQILLVQTIVITFIYLLELFIVQNFKKFLQRIQNYHHALFLGSKWSICPKQIFFGILLLSFSSTY